MPPHPFATCNAPARPRVGLLARLERKLDRRGGPDACHPWQGARSRSQWREVEYGLLREGRADQPFWRVHRLVLLLGSIPEEALALPEVLLLDWLQWANRYYREQHLEAAHQCDNSLCGNLRHLAWETHEENVERAKARREQREAAEATKARAQEPAPTVGNADGFSPTYTRDTTDPCPQTCVS